MRCADVKIILHASSTSPYFPPIVLILEGGGNFLMQHCGIIMTLDFLE